MIGPKKSIALSLLFAFFAQHSIGMLPVYAALITDNQNQVMPESTGNQQNPVGGIIIDQKNAVIGLASGIVGTAVTLLSGVPPSYIKTLPFTPSPEAVSLGSFSVDLSTNKVTLTKNDGTSYAGTYDPSTKKATLKNVDTANASNMTLQFATKTGTSTQYPDLVLSSMQIKEGNIQKDYKFADGILKTYSIQRTGTTQNESVSINRLDNGRWEVGSQVYGLKDYSVTTYSGFAAASDVSGFDQKDFAAEQSAAITLCTSKAYCQWQGNIFAVMSYKEGGEFKDRIVARNTSTGFQVSLVVDQADYKTGQTNDISVSNIMPSFSALPGYSVTYSEWIEQSYSKGYGLVLTSPTGMKSFVNFPSDDLLKINVSGQDKTFQVYVDKGGLIQLKDITTEWSSTQTELNNGISKATTETARLTNSLTAMDTTLANFAQAGVDPNLSKQIADLSAAIVALDPSPATLTALNDLKAAASGSLSTLAGNLGTAQTLRAQLTALKQILADNLAAMKSLKDKISLSNNYKTQSDFLTAFRTDSAKILTLNTGELQKNVNDFLVGANGLLSQNASTLTQFGTTKNKISDLQAQVKADIAAQKTKIQQLFTSLDQKKALWDASATSFDALLSGIDLSGIGPQLATLFAAADQLKISTEDRDILELVSYWTDQAIQSANGMQQSAIDSLKAELGKLKISSQNFYASAVTQKNNAPNAQSYTALAGMVSTMQNLLANYDGTGAGSLYAQLAPLESGASAIQAKLQGTVNALTGLQTKMTQAFQGLIIPAKNKINTTGWEDSVYVTPDGKTMYFMYTPNNFYDYLVSGGKDPIQYLGPARDGHHSNANPFEDSDLYVSYLVDGKWTAPVNMGLNTNTSESCAMVSPDGMKIYLSKPVTTGSSQMDLFVAQKKSDGTWGPLTAMNVPKLTNEWAKSNPHISNDGKTVYFTEFFMINGVQSSDLYYSVKKSDGTWGTPVSMGAQINSSEGEDQIWVSADQNTVYFNRGMELYSAKKVSGVWQAATKLNFGDTTIIGGEMSLTADGKQLFFSMVDPAIKDITVVTSFLQADGKWSKPVSVDELDKIPTTSLLPGANFDSTVYVDLNAPTTNFNKMILGSNTQWVDNGDEMMIPGTLNFDPDMLAKAKAMAPTVLRYPGGDLSDYYNWRNGVGTLAFRNSKASENARSQPILFGTDEMLRLSAELGSEPIFTVNIMTMTAQDAADWLRYTNSQAGKIVNGKPLPKVKYWEIGNEPYLNDSITPEQYAAKVNDFIKAMKAVDPTIQFGIAMRTSTLGASDFNDRLLANVTQKFDYVTVHNAYFPLAFSGNPTEKELYEAAMAASDVIKNDFVYFDTLLKKARPGQNIPVAVTEFNAIFSVQNYVMDTSKTPTFASAMYVADLLTSFAKTPNLMMANFWSLTGNGDFGAVSNTGETRPVYEVFTAYSEIMKGKLVNLDVTTPTFDNASTGLVFSNQSADAVSTLATLDGSTLRVLALNKDIDNPSSLCLMLPAGKSIVSVRVKRISDNALFDSSSDAGWVDVPCTPDGDYLDLNLDPHSISYLEIQIK